MIMRKEELSFVKLVSGESDVLELKSENKVVIKKTAE